MLYRAEGEQLSNLLAPMWRDSKRNEDGARDTARDFQWAKNTEFYREELARIR